MRLLRPFKCYIKRNLTYDESTIENRWQRFRMLGNFTTRWPFETLLEYISNNIMRSRVQSNMAGRLVSHAAKYRNCTDQHRPTVGHWFGWAVFTFAGSNAEFQYGAVVRALTSHQCGPGSIRRSGVICGFRLLLLYSGTCFSKVPKLYGRISGDIILFVSSKRRCLEARNFAVIFIFIPFTTCEKTSFTE